jgi:hypothetical protein
MVIGKLYILSYSFGFDYNNMVKQMFNMMEKTRLDSLTKQKLKIQGLERIKEQKRKEWMKLGSEVKSLGQQIHSETKMLIDMIP